MRRLLGDRYGATVVEFAFVAPIFLMFLFLLLDGGRALFTKQALNELAAATARCAAVDATNCNAKVPSGGSATSAQSWAVNRGITRSRLSLTAAMVTITSPATCNGQARMVQATIAMPYAKGTMNLLPQSTMPDTLTATSCFPLAA